MSGVGMWTWVMIDNVIYFACNGARGYIGRPDYKPADAMSLCEYLNSRRVRS